MIIDDIRNGVLDCNNQELFMKLVLKGFLADINNELKIRGNKLPHFIINVGDDLFFLNQKKYDYSKEPLEVTNENYIYNTIPRCMVNPQGIDLPTDQLTSPYTRGIFEYQSETDIYTFSAEFRRIPLKLTVDLAYYLDTFTDTMELIQQYLSKLIFIRTYNINYMGNVICCSYKVPESFSDNHTFEFTGNTTDNVNKNVELSIEIETNIPIFSPKTVADMNKVITNCDPPNPSDAYNINMK